VSADTIVNAAKFAWEIIKGGEATAEIGNSTANAVPQVDDWQALTDTRGPNVHRIHYSRLYLWPLDDYVHVEFEILLKWQYGARYKGGGAFIPNLWIEVPQCFVGWPWNADISITAHNPTNAGEAGAPLASIPVTVKGTVGSGAEWHHVEWGFILYGNGGISYG
jgi:hypothetical protein